MAIQISVGREDFDSLRKCGSYYVDKTELIYDLFHAKDNAVTLFTRPRRFGKTLNLSMIESFFDISRDSRSVFEGLNITNHSGFCQTWMNQYPVLFFSFKGVEDLDFDNAYRQLQAKIADYCKRIAFIADFEEVNAADRDIFHRLMFKEASIDDIKGSLKTLMRMLFAVYQKPVILLIDEYDVPLAKASEHNTSENGYYSKMLNVIRGIFEASLKTNEYLKSAVITGCLRIAKESIFTGTNNFTSYSVLDNQFSQYFGFTQEEVDTMLQAASKSNKSVVCKSWYNGYLFGNTSVYCPWDVVNYISALQYDENATPKNYWRNTSSNGVILEFASRKDLDITDKFEQLMNGGSILERISDELTYDSLHESEENLWSVLLMTGYLTKTKQLANSNQVYLRIPNEEILGIFEDSVVTLFKESLDRRTQEDLMNALWNGKTDEAEKLLSDFLWNTISFHDYHEDYYHAFLAGIFIGLGYAVESNRESGVGRFDILVKDRKNRRAMIIEAKKAKNAVSMEKVCAAAISQITQKGYIRGLDSGYEKVIGYGIAFFQKSAKLKLME